LDVRFSE
jgi:hypothetical protein